MATKNEYIASIMLEAADLLKNDTKSLNEVGIDRYFDQILNEAAEFSDISLLLEATDDIKEIQSDIQNLDINNKDSIKKAKSLSSRLLKWYYKVEPNKKFKALRTLIKISNAVSYQIASKLGSGPFNRIANAESDAAKVIGIIFVILTTMSGGIFQAITYFQTKAFAAYQYKYNIKDFDDNIKLLKDGYNKLKDKYDLSDDKKVKAGLQKSMDNYKKSIDELTKLKVKYDKLKNSNISARGAAIRLNEDKVNDKEATKSAIREAIDLLYDKSMKCNTMDEAVEYINKAERLESLIDE